MTDRLRLAAQAVADLADSRHPWADAKTWWDAVVALRRALAEHAEEPAPSNKCAHTSIIGVRDGMNWMERCYSCGKIMRQGGPTMTDFMVSPESIGPYLDSNPPPQDAPRPYPTGHECPECGRDPHDPACPKAP